MDTERVIYFTYNQVFFLLYLLLHWKRGDSKYCQTSSNVISKEKIHYIQINRNLGFWHKYSKTMNQSLRLWIFHYDTKRILKFFIHLVASISIYFTPDYLKLSNAIHVVVYCRETLALVHQETSVHRAQLLIAKQKKKHHLNAHGL